MIIVVDASVAVCWFLEEENRDFVNTLLHSGHELIAPDLISIEIGNALLRAIRHRRFDAADFRRGVGSLTTLFSRRVPLLEYESAAFAIAAQCGCSVYDACYIAVGKAEGAPLATGDERQIAACLTMGLPVSRLQNGFADLLAR